MRNNLSRTRHTTWMLLALLLCLMGTLGLAGRAGAQAVYNPGPPTIASVPGLQTALNGKGASRLVVGSRTQAFAVNYSNGTDTGANVRCFEYAPSQGITDLSPVYMNQGTTPYTVVAASIEYPAGTFYPLFFGAQKSIVVSPNSIALPDPCPVVIPGGAMYYIRTYITVAAGNTWPNTQTYGSNSGDGYSHGTTQTDQTQAAGFTYTDNFEQGFSHVAVIGVSDKNYIAAVIAGDSIGAGQGDSGLYGYPGDALFNAHIGYTKIAIPGEETTSFLGTGGFLRQSLLRFANTAISEYGVNDIRILGSTLAQLQANEIAVWQILWLHRLKVYACTVTPETSSTDGWATAANQTPASPGFGAVGVNYGTGGSAFVGTGVRTAYNDWLRAGAPVASATNITAVAIGTAGSVPCPYLAGYFDPADKVETARNSGIWKPQPPAISGTVTSTINLGGYAQQFTDSTKNFTAGQLSGATLSWTSGPNVGRTSNVTFVNPTTFDNSGNGMYNASIGDAYTLTFTTYTGDGIHPQPSGHALAATAIDTTKFTP